MHLRLKKGLLQPPIVHEISDPRLLDQYSRHYETNKRLKVATLHLYSYLNVQKRSFHLYVFWKPHTSTVRHHRHINCHHFGEKYAELSSFCHIRNVPLFKKRSPRRTCSWTVELRGLRHVFSPRQYERFRKEMTSKAPSCRPSEPLNQPPFGPASCPSPVDHVRATRLHRVGSVTQVEVSTIKPWFRQIRRSLGKVSQSKSSEKYLLGSRR